MRVQLALLIHAVLEHGVIGKGERVAMEVKLARRLRGWNGEQCNEEKANEGNHEAA